MLLTAGANGPKRHTPDDLQPHQGALAMDMRLELVPLPTTDPDRSKEFYVDRVGFKLDHDIQPGNGLRVIQLTPPGSACSIVVGVGISDPDAPRVLNLHLVVDDVEEARAQLSSKDVDVSGVHDMGGGQVRVLQRPGRELLGAPATPRVSPRPFRNSRLVRRVTLAHASWGSRTPGQARVVRDHGFTGPPLVGPRSVRCRRRPRGQFGQLPASRAAGANAAEQPTDRPCTVRRSPGASRAGERPTGPWPP